MKTVFDLESDMYRVLTGSEDLMAMISGSVYREGDRPVNSDNEDICLNTIALTIGSIDQSAITNVNIYAKDVIYTIAGKSQLVADRNRLNMIADEVIKAINGSDISGVVLSATTMALLADNEAKQHYVNVRVDWNIQDK